MSNLMTAFLLLLNTAASVAGSLLLKFAASSGHAVYASLGCACWAISASTFLTLAKEQELGVLAVITTAMAMLAVNAIGIIVFGETLSVKKTIGLSFLVTGMVLVALSATSK